MYGKIFESMYDGTLSADWKAMITFQQFIVLADSEGIVDYTPPALSRRTGIPLEILEHGIAKLQEPDEYSRSPEFDGRRIALLDEHRPWGWSIVNYEHYRDLASREDRLVKDRERKRKQRERQSQATDSKGLSETVRDCPSSSEMSRHEDADADELKKGRKATDGFDDFWKVYPKKVKKKPALDIWRRKKPDAELLVADVKNRLQNDMRWKSGFIPDPTTYLSQERWNDEVTKPESSLESSSETTADWALILGIVQAEDESDDKFQTRVRDAKISSEYQM